jgi:hypothetical protein
MPGSRVPYDARVKVLTIQHNHWGRFFFSIQECIFGIRRIQGKMRSTVWTVHSTPTWTKISDFQEERLKSRTASF